MWNGTKEKSPRDLERENVMMLRSEMVGHTGGKFRAGVICEFYNYFDIVATAGPNRRQRQRKGQM